MSGDRPHIETLVHQLGRIATALENTADGDYVDRKQLRKILKRIAAADERRNELLEADQLARRESWEAAEMRQDERLRAIVDGVTTDQQFGLPPDPPQG